MTMITKSLMAAAFALVPVCSSALTVTPTSFATSETSASVFMFANTPTDLSGGTISVGLVNDAGAAAAFAFDLLSTFGLSGLTFSVAGNTYVDDFSILLGAGASEAFTITYTAASNLGANFVGELSATVVDGATSPVPLPASALLLVGALAGLGAARRRKG